jgi:hypothetical protein
LQIVHCCLMSLEGEMVAGIIGLDDSKFQDVIDNMTEEDWKVAVQVSRPESLRLRLSDLELLSGR